MLCPVTTEVDMLQFAHVSAPAVSVDARLRFQHHTCLLRGPRHCFLSHKRLLAPLRHCLLLVLPLHWESADTSITVCEECVDPPGLTCCLRTAWLHHVYAPWLHHVYAQELASATQVGGFLIGLIGRVTPATAPPVASAVATTSRISTASVESPSSSPTAPWRLHTQVRRERDTRQTLGCQQNQVHPITGPCNPPTRARKHREQVHGPRVA